MKHLSLLISKILHTCFHRVLRSHASRLTIYPITHISCHSRKVHDAVLFVHCTTCYSNIVSLACFIASRFTETLLTSCLFEYPLLTLVLSSLGWLRLECRECCYLVTDRIVLHHYNYYQTITINNYVLYLHKLSHTRHWRWKTNLFAKMGF